MSRVLSDVECPQCGFLEASYEVDCGTCEYWINCLRCGYSESWKHKSRFSNGHLEIGVKEVRFSAGALWAEDAKTGIASLSGLGEDEIGQIATRVRDDIASGKLSPRSYVTKYNFETGEVTAEVGQLPTLHPQASLEAASAQGV
jgi:Zn ribbon nucleic-acid-binding protein